MNITIVTPPAAEPVTLTEAKTQCRIDGSDSDTHLGVLISAARGYVEDITGRALVTQTLECSFPSFYVPLTLPRTPVASVSQVTYYDEDNSGQTLSTDVYSLDMSRNPPRIALVYGQSWPTVFVRGDAVTVRFVAGYGAASTDVPDSIRQAILMVVEYMFDGNAEPPAIDSLLASYRVPMFS